MTPTERATELMRVWSYEDENRVHKAFIRAITEAEKEGFDRGWKQAGEMDGMTTHEGTEPDKPELIIEAIEAEREECAKVAIDKVKNTDPDSRRGGDMIFAAEQIAAAIRAKGQG